jgi:hypothetical protein
MKGIELLEQNPESAKLICSYYLEVMLESLNDDSLPEDFKDHVRAQAMDNRNIAAILDGNPRNLFDFFDEHKIIIEIRYSREFGQFVPEVNGVSSYTFSKRKDAEGVAVEEAILMLEQRLTKSVIDKENS